MNSVPKGLISQEEFMQLSDTAREAYVNEQVKQIGTKYLKLLSSVTEIPNPYSNTLYELVSGQKVSGSGADNKRGGYVKRYGRTLKRKKTNTN